MNRQKQDREIIVLALAQNADPKDPNTVLTQAIDGLRAEFEMIRATRANTLSGYEKDLDIAEYNHSHRLEALELFVSQYMVVRWAAPKEAEAVE